jgi:uncharacterized protein
LKKFERELVRGWLHEPRVSNGRGLVLTHGAGTNCESPLLSAVAEEFCGAGYHVLRFDLPYRQQRPTGPPIAGASGKDRDGLRHAVAAMREITPEFVILGGHSYGGRQSSMAASEDSALANLLLLLAYPLHPPRKKGQLRTAHFPNLETPALFIHGMRDPFGTVEEMQEAFLLIPGRHHLFPIEKTGHELRPDLAPAILRETQCFATASNE